MFATDRDLLALEPLLFRDAAWAGQRLVRGTASTSYVTLNFDTQDVGLGPAGVGPGHVVVVAGAALEVLERISDSALTVSRLRARITDDPVQPAPAAAADANVTTFGPQIEMVHRQVLRSVGIAPGAAPGEVGESAVTNPGDLVHAEALGALFFIYSAIAAGAGDASAAAEHAAHYRELFSRERARLCVMLDLDGDGEPDGSRCPGSVQLSRG